MIAIHFALFAQLSPIGANLIGYPKWLVASVSSTARKELLIIPSYTPKSAMPSIALAVFEGRDTTMLVMLRGGRRFSLGDSRILFQVSKNFG